MRVIRLKDIEESITKYANAISNILNIDVEIVDDELNRITGSGIYHKKRVKILSIKD